MEKEKKSEMSEETERHVCLRVRVKKGLEIERSRRGWTRHDSDRAGEGKWRWWRIGAGGGEGIC